MEKNHRLALVPWLALLWTTFRLGVNADILVSVHLSQAYQISIDPLTIVATVLLSFSFFVCIVEANIYYITCFAKQPVHQGYYQIMCGHGRSLNYGQYSA